MIKPKFWKFCFIILFSFFKLIIYEFWTTIILYNKILDLYSNKNGYVYKKHAKNIIRVQRDRIFRFSTLQLLLNNFFYYYLW